MIYAEIKLSEEEAIWNWIATRTNLTFEDNMDDDPVRLAHNKIGLIIATRPVLDEMVKHLTVTLPAMVYADIELRDKIGDDDRPINPSDVIIANMLLSKLHDCIRVNSL